MFSTAVVTFGVPQGSYLGPSIFFNYVNNLRNGVSILSTSLFADHTNLATSGNPAEVVQSPLNEDLEKVHWWLLCVDRL